MPKFKDTDWSKSGQVRSPRADPNGPIDKVSLSSACFNSAGGATQFNAYLSASHQGQWQGITPFPAGAFDPKIVGEEGIVSGIHIGSYRTISNNMIRDLVVVARAGKTPSPSDLSNLVNFLLP